MFANYTDAEATKPIYLAGHEYGSGRVVYIGSGEVWRNFCLLVEEASEIGRDSE